MTPDTSPINLSTLSPEGRIPFLRSLITSAHIEDLPDQPYGYAGKGIRVTTDSQELMIPIVSECTFDKGSPVSQRSIFVSGHYPTEFIQSLASHIPGFPCIKEVVYSCGWQQEWGNGYEPQTVIIFHDSVEPCHTFNVSG